MRLENFNKQNDSENSEILNKRKRQIDSNIKESNASINRLHTLHDQNIEELSQTQDHIQITKDNPFSIN